MKTKLLCLAALLLAAVNLVAAAPLTATTAVHTKPDPAAPVFSFLKAGTEPVPAADAIATTPAGWMAVEVSGPFEVYVENKDLTKSLDVAPGTPMRLAPKPDAGVLMVAEKGDKTRITGLRGKWTQLSLEKPLTGYIRVAGTTSPPETTSSATPPPAAATPAPEDAERVTTAGRPAESVDSADSTTPLPRQFAGIFVSTRRFLSPRRPYDYALNDDSGRRFAYLDVSKLLLTEQIEKYIDHRVVVFGSAKTVPDTKDIVIRVETLRLR